MSFVINKFGFWYRIKIILVIFAFNVSFTIEPYMAKKATKKEDNKLNLEAVLMNCRNYLRYPPQYNDEVFEQVLEQVENFKKNN